MPADNSQAAVRQPASKSLLVKAESQAAPLTDEIIATARRGEMKKMVKWLRKSSVDAQYPIDGNTLLHTAVINGQPDLVRELIRRGANLNLANHDGSTALMAAAQVGASTQRC